eukprot:ANDGO_03420.mRNA.1 hypothetical protein
MKPARVIAFESAGVHRVDGSLRSSADDTQPICASEPQQHAGNGPPLAAAATATLTVSKWYPQPSLYRALGWVLPAASFDSKTSKQSRPKKS